MIKYRLGEWQIILDAYCYEIKEDSIASDYTFDMCCKAVEENGSTIPEFDPSTGNWIHEVLKQGFGAILERAYIRYKELGEGTSVIHLIPNEVINHAFTSTKES
jgi:hypothetical protein